LVNVIGSRRVPNLGVYDCVYMALAAREGCVFVTADDKLVKKFQAQFPFIVPLPALPA
jgi:predicted nucleic acid-binding protein